MVTDRRGLVALCRFSYAVNSNSQPYLGGTWQVLRPQTQYNAIYLISK